MAFILVVFSMVEVRREIFHGPQNVGLDFRNYFSSRNWVWVDFLGLTLLFHKENTIKIKKVENLINTYFLTIFQISAPKM
jgi:hypothetical protein